MSSINAPVHDMLIRIKNAYMARRAQVSPVIFSKHKESILQVLKEHGYIADYTVLQESGNKSFLSIALHDVKSTKDIPVIKFYSKPSKPWYITHKDIKPVAGGIGIGIISTNKGLMDTKRAWKEGVGGELIAEIY